MSCALSREAYLVLSGRICDAPLVDKGAVMSQDLEHRRIRALYAEDASQAEEQLWGRRVDPLTRRGFLNRAGLTALGAALGATIPFADQMPLGLMPIAFADSKKSPIIPGKHPGMTILNDRPINAETPAHLLDEAVTSAERLFVRNNGLPPVDVDLASWRVRIDGESAMNPLSFSLNELKSRFTHHSYRLVLECAGNGRAEFFPPAKGNQWSTGAVGCVEWTGVRLRDVLAAVGVKKDAVYVAYEGADTHLSGDPKKRPISRGVPLSKAMEDECLIAWAMNGAPIPALHGHPLRLVIPGYPGSCSGKWLTRILIRDRVHDGTKMTGYAYRIPCDPVAPGTQVAKDKMCIIEAMPTKSLITSPRSGIEHSRGQPLPIRGHAWSGKAEVTSVAVSVDFGATWRPLKLAPGKNRFAWRQFSGHVRLASPGYYEIWTRATDATGASQPMVLPGWNPKGYLNNACHRVAVRAV